MKDPLYKFVQQLNVVYSVTDRPQLTFPLSDESLYLVMVEFKRMTKASIVRKEPNVEALVEFYDGVYNELQEMVK